MPGTSLFLFVSQNCDASRKVFLVDVQLSSKCLLTAAMPCTHAQFSVWRKSLGMLVEWLSSWHQVHLQHPYHCFPLPCLLCLSLPGAFANLVDALGTIPSYSPSISSGSFGSALSPTEIVSIPSLFIFLKDFLSSHSIHCLAPFPSELRSSWPVIASGSFSSCALRYLIGGWHPLLPTPPASRIVISSRLPLS